MAKLPSVSLKFYVKNKTNKQRQKNHVLSPLSLQMQEKSLGPPKTAASL